jgi:hypothetical protein
MSEGIRLVDTVGWLATAVFASSYLLKGQTMLRRVQAVGACLWILYGLLLHAAPVIAANIIVAAVAFYSSRRSPEMGNSLAPRDHDGVY